MEAKNVCEKIAEYNGWCALSVSAVDSDGYPNSLDQVMRAVKRKVDHSLELRLKFLNTMREVCGQPCSDYKMLMATPKQFAEGLLRTLGDWKG